MAKPVIASISKRFPFPAARVFEAWLDPAMLRRWMFGSAVRDERIVRLECDPRAGGRFSFVVERNGQEIDHLGEYLEITRPTKLVFTWGIRENLPETSTVTVLIEPLGESSCQLTLAHAMDAKWADFADGAAASWQKMADALERALT